MSSANRATFSGVVAASAASRDLIDRRDRDDARVVRHARVGVAAFAVVAAVVALNPPGGIVELTIFSGSLFAVCFVPTILLGLHWRQGNEAGALAAFGTGISVLIGWVVGGLGDVLHEVFPALLASTAAYVTISARGKAVTDPGVQQLFETKT